MSKTLKKSKKVAKVNETEDGREPFDGEFLSELLLYRVDWDFEVEIEHEGQPVKALQHVYTFIAVEKDRIGKVSQEWDKNAQNLTFRVVSKTLEEEAYRAGLQDGYDACLVEMRKSEEQPAPVSDEPTLFD